MERLHLRIQIEGDMHLTLPVNKPFIHPMPAEPNNMIGEDLLTEGDGISVEIVVVVDATVVPKLKSLLDQMIRNPLILFTVSGLVETHFLEGLWTVGGLPR